MAQTLRGYGRNISGGSETLSNPDPLQKTRVSEEFEDMHHSCDIWEPVP